MNKLPNELKIQLKDCEKSFEQLSDGVIRYSCKGFWPSGFESYGPPGKEAEGGSPKGYQTGSLWQGDSDHVRCGHQRPGKKI